MYCLLTFFSLLAIIAASQSGYEYNKPGKPFSPATTPNYSGLSGPSSIFPTSPTSVPFSSTPHDDTSSYGSTSGFQGIPGNYPRPSQDHSGLPPSVHPSTFPGQTNSGSSNTVLNNGLNTNFPGNGPNYPGQNFHENEQTHSGQNFPSQHGVAPSGLGVPPFGPVAPVFQSGDDNGLYEGGDYSAIPGEPDKDYPIFTEIPQTSFRCEAQAYPGYYADVEARCQVFHICANNITYDFLCPNGTIFSQEVFVCVWWNQFDCSLAPNFYELNANIYDYSITGSGSHIEPGSNSIIQGSPFPLSPGNFQGFPGNLNILNQFATSPRPTNIYTGNQGQKRPGSYIRPQSLVNYSNNVGSQEPSIIPQGPTSYPSITGSQGAESVYPTGTGPQQPFQQLPTYPGNTDSEVLTLFPGNTGSIRPSLSPSNIGSQAPSNYPSIQPQEPSTSYHTSTSGSGSFPPYSSYPNSYTNVPSYAGNIKPQGPIGTYPSSSEPSNFPGPNGPTFSPSTQAPNYGSRPGQRFPSNKPNGSNLSSASIGRPQGPQGNRFPQPQPNREYLPPKI